MRSWQLRSGSGPTRCSTSACSARRGGRRRPEGPAGGAGGRAGGTLAFAVPDERRHGVPTLPPTQPRPAAVLSSLSQIDGAAKRGAAAASEGESRTAKRLRSSSSAAQEAQEAAQLAAVHAWLQRVEVSESRAACFGGGAPNELLRAAVVLRRHLEEGTAGTASEEDVVSIVAELRAQVALLQQARRDVAKNVTGKQKKALKEARKESEAWEAQASKLRGALQAEQAGRADADAALGVERLLRECAERDVRRLERAAARVESPGGDTLPEMEPGDEEEDAASRTDLRGITFSMRDELPSGRSGFSRRCRVAVVHLREKTGTAVKKLVPVIRDLLGILGATVVDVPTDHEGLGTQCIWEAKEKAQDRLALDLIRIKNPDFTIAESRPQLPAAEGRIADHKVGNRWAQPGSVSAGPGARLTEDWLQKGAKYGDRTPIPPEGLFPATDRDSTAGRRLWNRKHCAGLYLKGDGTTKYQNDSQEVLLIGGPGITKPGETRSLLIDRHRGKGGGVACNETIRAGIIQMRQRQLRLGAKEAELLKPTDFVVLGGDNTEYEASEVNGVVGIFAQVRVLYQDCLALFRATTVVLLVALL